MNFKKKLKNYATGSDERTIDVVGSSSLITLIIGVVIFLVEMLVKFEITKDLHSITWEAVLFIIMIVVFVVIHLLNKIRITIKF
ncbi:hypothetical protein [Clostridium fungisolvens]|uniref:Uncharacterized protein n=1 Tax=Clostridium fungisolvens TaxID=1604897 RepID=A0A6V8SGM2_9CLOT|nr:hypothetical protein [Clostridium fungisolvens]GFP76364.1 hypothetical protein bsdtw1_02466 [Clostridium fungisolvens]